MKSLMSPSIRAAHPLQTALAALVAFALVAATAVLGAINPTPASAATATLTVTQAPQGGGQVTVTGAGFDATNGATYNLALAPGNYANYAAASAANALVAGSQQVITPQTDGTFTATVTVGAPTFTSYKVFVTHSTAPVADTTVSAWVLYPAAPTPTVTVTPPAGVNLNSLDPTTTTTVTVTGTGFVPNRVNPSDTSGARPPFSGLFGGAYVVFGKFANTWKPSQSAPSSSRTVLAQKWVVAPAQATGDPYVALNEDGSFQLTLDLAPTAANDLLSGNYGIYTYSGSGAKYAAFETYTPLTFLPRPTVTVKKADGSVLAAGETVASGTVLTVEGTGFTARAGTNGLRLPLAGQFAGVYVAFGKYADQWRPSQNAPSSARKNGSTPASVKWAVPAANTATIGGAPAGAITLASDGSFSTTLLVDENFSGVPATGNFGIYTYGGSGAKPAAFETYTPITFASASPAPTPAPAPAPEPASDPTIAGSLSWGISTNFTNYVVGNIAKGSVATSGGATASGSVFNFGQASAAFDHANRSGSADYSGAVRYTGHNGSLALTFANPSVVVTSPSSAMLYMTVNGSRVAFANVNLAAASVSQSGGATFYNNAQTTLTTAGASAFNGFYGAGQRLDNLSFVVGKAGAAPAGSSGTIRAASVNQTFTPPATPPATTGISLSKTALNALASGKEATIVVDGFEPFETGIAIVVYSTPTVLATNLTADADGKVTWTGKLPAGLTGKHTLTVQGSVAKGIELTVLGTEQPCIVTDATLDWGFKESFLAYIDSNIAKGTWALSGVTDEDNIFHWKNGEGSVNELGDAGTVAFEGSIQFTGHDGALDTTIANPQIELGENGIAYLLLDVTGETQEGEAVSQEGVRFAKLDISGLEKTDTNLSIADATATLTAEGAAAFGTYPAGEQLDTVAFTLPITATCAGDAATTEPMPISAQADDAGMPTWLIILIIVVVLAIVAAGVVFFVRRRNG